METMIEMKGREYVSQWPRVVAGRLGISSEYTAAAMRATGIITTDAEEYDLRTAFLDGSFTEAVANLTPEQAKAVVDQLRLIRKGLDQRARTDCHYCGLPLSSNGECRECGEPML